MTLGLVLLGILLVASPVIVTVLCVRFWGNMDCEWREPGAPQRGGERAESRAARPVRMNDPPCSAALLSVSALLVCIQGVAWASPTMTSAEPETLKILVRADGAGDVPTVQAAIDSISAVAGVVGLVTLEPGFYDEIARIPEPRPILTIRAPAGPESTRLKEVVFEEDGRYGGVPILFTGLSLSAVARATDRQAVWNHCVFDGGVDVEFLRGSASNDLFKGCVFRGRTYLYTQPGTPILRGLRFESAPLFASTGQGNFVFRDCDFIGPVDTAAVARPGGSNYVGFEGCRFRKATIGISGPRSYMDQTETVGIIDCSFEDITRDAVAYTYDGPFDSVHDDDFPDSLESTAWFVVIGSRFVDCGTAVRLGTRKIGSGLLRHLNIVNSAGDAIWLRRTMVTVESTLVVGSGGHGLVYLPAELGPEGFRDVTTIQHCRFEDNAGSGFVWADTLTVISRYATIRNNMFARNGRHGALMYGRGGGLTENTFADNRGDGLRYVSTEVSSSYAGGQQELIERNTFVGNDGAGASVSLRSGAADDTVVIRNNLAAGNSTFGLTVSPQLTPTPYANDAYANTVANYSGLDLTGNLQVSPRFCNVYSGDYHLAESSPCAPSGPYGQIGAFGVGCTSSHVELAALRGNGGQPPNAAGMLKVGVLGHRLFDATAIDATTALLGGALVAKQGPGLQFRDTNHDGIVDAVLAFRGEAIGTTVGGLAAFEGLTRDGGSISGSIEVREVGRRRHAETVAANGLQLEIRSITPNPSNGRFVVEFSSPEDLPLQFALYDVAGRRVRGVTLPAATAVRHLEVSGVQPGVYFAVLRSHEHSVQKRIVVR